MGNSKKQKQKNKVALPPMLPPDVPEDDIEVSDEDVDFVDNNPIYAGFVSNLDTQSITRHINRPAGAKDDDDDALEVSHEQRERKRSLAAENDNTVQHEVDPVDALPIKTLDGELQYKSVKARSKFANNKDETVGENEDEGRDNGIVKLTKAEKRAKMKKQRKEAKYKGKDATGEEDEEVQQSSQAEVLAEVEKDLSVEEDNEKKKLRLAEIGTTMLADPEGNIKDLKEMLQICKGGDQDILVLGLKSLVAVFKDIIPGNRIRLPTDKELAMVVSKDVRKTRLYESTLLNVYKAYLQKLMSLERVFVFKRVAVRCFCTLLEANPRFNYREQLLKAVVRNISSTDVVIRKLCCDTIKSIFTNEGKHGGEVTVEAVQLIADLVKDHECHLHPDSVEVFLSLSFDEDLRKPESTKPDPKKMKKKFYKTGRRNQEIKQVPASEKKKNKQEMMSKTREEVKADFMAASFAQDAMEKRKIQSDTLTSVFNIYFRILKHTLHSGSDANGPIVGPFGANPLLAPCLNGIGKFSHLIDMDFMADLMKHLRMLAGGSSDPNRPSEKVSCHLTVSERLRCCIVAFKVMKSNLDALNVDLQEFFVQLYNLILEYRPGRDRGEVLAEALKIMLCDDRQHDMQRAAAFIKRLASFSLCFGAAESMAALVTLKHLLQKNVKCRDLLENDAGGGSLSGSISKYQPYATDPSLSGAFATVLWELTLLSKHYHPTVSTMASGISSITNTHDQVYRANVTPQQAFMDMSLDKETFTPKTVQKQSNSKRKRNNQASLPAEASGVDEVAVDEKVVRDKLTEHFLLVKDMEENERLRRELEQTKIGLQLYKEYRKQKKQKTK